MIATCWPRRVPISLGRHRHILCSATTMPNETPYRRRSIASSFHQFVQPSPEARCSFLEVADFFQPMSNYDRAPWRGEDAGWPLICINAPLRATTIMFHRRSFAHADNEYCNRARVIVAVGFIVSALWAGWRRMIRLWVPADSAPALAIVANCASCHDWDGQVVWAYYCGR